MKGRVEFVVVDRAFLILCFHGGQDRIETFLRQLTPQELPFKSVNPGSTKKRSVGDRLGDDFPARLRVLCQFDFNDYGATRKLNRQDVGIARFQMNFRAEYGQDWFLRTRSFIRQRRRILSYPCALAPPRYRQAERIFPPAPLTAIPSDTTLLVGIEVELPPFRGQALQRLAPSLRDLRGLGWVRSAFCATSLSQFLSESSQIRSLPGGDLRPGSADRCAPQPHGRLDRTPTCSRHGRAQARRAGICGFDSIRFV